MFFSKYFKKNKKTDEARDVVVGLIQSQLMMYGIQKSNIPKKATDIYSLGYIAGMLDVYFNVLKIDDFGLRLDTIEQTYVDLFGYKLGRKSLEKAEECLVNDDKYFYEAMSDGGTELIKYMNKDIPAPFGWISYVKGDENLIK